MNNINEVEQVNSLVGSLSGNVDILTVVISILPLMQPPASSSASVLLKTSSSQRRDGKKQQSRS